MSSGMPELGSKISLISKADIRYEGRLFTVDPQECTIALASVRSFGTEDRETQFPVAPQSQVYDYILFRGSDIKDIRVLNNVPSMPNDPAIMQMSVPPSLGNAQAPPQFAGQFSHPVVGQQPFQQYHPMAGFGGSVQLNKTSELSAVELSQQPITGPIGSGIVHHGNIGNQVKDQGSMLDLIGGGSQQNPSRSNTPGLGAHRKSPTADQATQFGQVGPGAGGSAQHQRDSRRGSNPQPKPNNQRPRTDSRNRQQRYPTGGVGGPSAPQHQPQQSGQQNQHHHQNQQHQHPQQHHQQQNQHHHQQNQHHQQQNQHHQQQHNQHPGAGGFGRGGWRGRSRGRGRGFIPRGGKNTLKFENDYDFEQANTEFEELRSQLAKTKISDGDAKPDVAPVQSQPTDDVNPPTCVQGEVDKKDDSGNETGAGEPEVEDDCTAYDKNKSFFDNISCEAVERSKGRSQRTDWRTERKLNSETFGVASARRGAWRGRGGWRHNPHHQPWRPMRGGGRPLNQPGPHAPRPQRSQPAPPQPQPQPTAN